MSKLRITLSFVLVLGLIIAGCSNNDNPLTSQEKVNEFQQPGPKVAIPPGATLLSAALNVNIIEPSNQTVNVHRVTDSWDEAGPTGVTWNNFGGAYDASVEGSFACDIVGWRMVDVTGLVQGWLDGSYPNDGLLLDQEIVEYPRAIYYSRESGTNISYLEVCYLDGADTVCEVVETTADTYINEFLADDNFGTETIYFTGYAADTLLEKQALLWFELPVEEPELAAIGDYVWYDDNMDGIQDSGEAGIPGVTVSLYDCFDTLLATTTTDADGYYLFSGLMPGDYYVEFELLSGYVFSPQDQGADDMDSDADMTTGKTICTTLDPGETDLSWDAGMYEPMMEGCTRTIGYWMNHAGFGPQDNEVSPLLPIWLGTDGGAKSLAVTDSAIARDVLKMMTYGHPSNGITKLYAQLLAAKLSINSGASDNDVADAIADADAFLAMYDWNDWSGLNEEDQDMVGDWKDMLDDYNNGDIGPGHCDDQDDEDDDDDDDGEGGDRGRGRGRG